MARVPAKKYRTRADVMECLLRAKALLDSRAFEPITLRTVAVEAGLSPFHFQKLFKRVYRVSPHAYLTKKRLARAHELLRSGELTVTETCFEVGFSSPAHFSRLFQRHFGVPPVQVRRRPAIPPLGG